jgi:hypothetical protein
LPIASGSEDDDTGGALTACHGHSKAVRVDPCK